MKRYASLLFIGVMVLVAQAAADEFVIGPEDMLQITVWGSPELSVHIPVRPDGRISVPLVGDVMADGLTPMGLKAFLEKEYTSYIKTPNVSVVITAINSYKVFVIGGGAGSGAAANGAVTLKRTTTLLQLLAQLGSLQGADLKSAYVLRAGKRLQVDFMKLVNEGDASQDLVLKRDDVVFIPPDLENRIKVVGAVKNPGVFPYVKGMTALDAVLGAGGFNEFASQNGVEVIRQEGGDVKHYDARLKDVIRSGEVSKNVALKPGDIVSVKTSLF